MLVFTIFFHIGKDFQKYPIKIKQTKYEKNITRLLEINVYSANPKIAGPGASVRLLSSADVMTILLTTTCFILTKGPCYFSF